MKIEIVIPSLGRLEKLRKCLGSIDTARKHIDCNFYVYVYFSRENEYKLVDEFLKLYPYIFTRLLTEEYNTSTFWNNHFKDSNADITLYLNDDIVMHPNCLEEIIKSMNEHFPDLDGVIGINQENLPKDQALQSAFGAIGVKYMERFPNKAVFCPIYQRFYGDREALDLLEKNGKFCWEEKARIIHLHPAFVKDAMDETHTLVRKHLSHDKIAYLERKQKGLIWGETYEF